MTDKRKIFNIRMEKPSGKFKNVDVLKAIRKAMADRTKKVKKSTIFVNNNV